MVAVPDSSKSLLKKFSFKDRIQKQLVFPDAPILTSSECDWNGIYLEYHYQSSTDTPKIYNSNHLVGINLNPNAIEAQLNLNGVNRRIYHQQGMVAIKPKGAYYQYSTSEANQFIMLEIEPELVDRIAADWVNPDVSELLPCFAPQGDRLLLELAIALKNEIKSGCIGGKVYSDSITTALIAHLIRNYANFSPQPLKDYRGLAPQQLDNVIDYIQTYLEHNLGLAELAQLSNLSPFYFSRLFKESTGITPYQYISKLRMERAKRLLKNTELAIADIALSCGFASQSCFSTAFRKGVGVTPKTYRDRISYG